MLPNTPPNMKFGKIIESLEFQFEYFEHYSVFTHSNSKGRFCKSCSVNFKFRRQYDHFEHYCHQPSEYIKKKNTLLEKNCIARENYIAE